jgi:hypothetical protein
MNIPLKLFLHLAVNNFEGWIVLDSQALIVECQKDDPQELLHHIETITDATKLSKLNLKAGWRLWRKWDWDLYQHQVQIKYKNWSARKAVWDRYDRNMKKLSLAIVKMTGIDMDTAKLMADKIITTRPHKAANFDCELES